MEEHIKRELQRTLKNNTHERWEASSTGKLDPNKLGMTKVTDKIFKQKIPNTGKKYNVELLVDVSGSMYGDRLKTSIETVQEIIGYFFGIIDVNITFFDICETKMRGRDVLSINTKPLSDWDFCKSKFGSDITKVSINGKPQYIKTKDGDMNPSGGGKMSSCGGNWEVCNLVSAWENIQKKDGEKVIIILGDGAIQVDYLSSSEMVEQDLHFAGQPASRYNEDTYKDTVDRIVNSGVPILPMCIGYNYYERYFDNAVGLSNPSQAGSLILDFFNKEFNNN